MNNKEKLQFVEMEMLTTEIGTCHGLPVDRYATEHNMLVTQHHAFCPAISESYTAEVRVVDALAQSIRMLTTI
jgi:hypothetical protein